MAVCNIPWQVAGYARINIFVRHPHGDGTHLDNSNVIHRVWCGFCLGIAIVISGVGLGILLGRRDSENQQATPVCGELIHDSYCTIIDDGRKWSRIGGVSIRSVRINSSN